MSSSPLEERIRVLEKQLDCKTRIEALENAIPKDLLQLHDELHPATALSHQSQILAPIIYRKQAVLASRSKLETDMKKCQQILQLLLIGQSDAQKSITETTIVDAPIIVETAASNDDLSVSKMDTTYQKIVELQGRTNVASQKLDRMMRQYQTLIGAVSETLALAHDKVRLAEENK